MKHYDKHGMIYSYDYNEKGYPIRENKTIEYFYK